jgi:hypothetical protein
MRSLILPMWCCLGGGFPYRVERYIISGEPAGEEEDKHMLVP